MIKGIGVQITKYNHLGVKSNIFIPINKIQDILINEGITRFEIRYYMAIVLNEANENKMNEIHVIFEVFLISKDLCCFHR